MISIVFNIIYIVLALFTGYILFFAVAGLFYRESFKHNEQRVRLRRMAILIPGYKEDGVIVEVAKRAMEQSYPTTLFDVIIIADSFKQETLTQLRKLPVKLIEVSFKKSTKARALNRAMEQLSEDYEVAVILDADNIMEPEALNKFNRGFDCGYRVVQGHRTAKNTNTPFAILDAISEEINNHIFRKGHRVTGLSSAIIGSGMAFDYAYFKRIMAGVDAVGGFDKELELKMLREGIVIAYQNDTLIYDEKVQKAQVFGNQRTRWLSAQWHYFHHFFPEAIVHLLRYGNIDFFDKAFQMVQPPRVMLLGITGIAALLVWILAPFENICYQWSILFLACIVALGISVPRKFYKKETLWAALRIPRIVIIMIHSMLRLKGANKEFIHTEHTTEG